MRKLSLFFVLFCLTAASLCCLPSHLLPFLTPNPKAGAADRLARLGGYPCPDSEFTCLRLTVPLDHQHPDNGQTTEVVFAVLPASGTRKGMFVTAVGGPGGSGLEVKDYYILSFDPQLRRHFDIVFFDQRGVGASGGLECAQAAADYYLTEVDLSMPEGQDEAIAAAQTFTQKCIAEMGDPPILPYLGTAQAIEDLEAFRKAMGDETFYLYGESYGTQFAQAYAAAYPQHLAALILDGTVDVTLPIDVFLAEQAAAFENTLRMTFQACDADPLCRQDIGAPAASVYDDLAARLADSPLSFTFPLPSGGRAERLFTFGNLETAAAGYLYSETQRTIFLRALAAYARDGDLTPMARILYEYLNLDPETLAAIPDPNFSNAVFYGVECQDYTFFSGAPEERARAYLNAGAPLQDRLAYFSSIFYGDLPCVFWPNTSPPAERPPYLTLKGVPTLVLGSTADPATPLSNGRNVFQHLEEGYLLVQEGGPHVIFGWGNECVDSLVVDFLVKDQRPPKQTTCIGAVIGEYVPISPRNAADFATPLEAMNAVYQDIYHLPEYYFWDVKSTLAVGCSEGGTLTIEPTSEGNTFELEDCAFSQGFVMNGDGNYKFRYDGTFNLNVQVSGIAEGTLEYRRQYNGAVRLTGQYDGRPINLSEEGK